MQIPGSEGRGRGRSQAKRRKQLSGLQAGAQTPTDAPPGPPASSLPELSWRLRVSPLLLPFAQPLRISPQKGSLSLAAARLQ